MLSSTPLQFSLRVAARRLSRKAAAMPPSRVTAVFISHLSTSLQCRGRNLTTSILEVLWECEVVLASRLNRSDPPKKRAARRCPAFANWNDGLSRALHKLAQTIVRNRLDVVII